MVAGHFARWSSCGLLRAAVVFPVLGPKLPRQRLSHPQHPVFRRLRIARVDAGGDAGAITPSGLSAPDTRNLLFLDHSLNRSKAGVLRVEIEVVLWNRRCFAQPVDVTSQSLPCFRVHCGCFIPRSASPVGEILIEYPCYQEGGVFGRPWRELHYAQFLDLVRERHVVAVEPLQVLLQVLTPQEVLIVPKEEWCAPPMQPVGGYEEHAERKIKEIGDVDSTGGLAGDQPRSHG